MKRIHFTITLTLILFLTYNTVKAQAPATTPINCIAKGKSLIDVYYGFPNFYSTILEQDFNKSFDATRGLRPDYTVSDFGPVGIKYERLITDQIGVGFNFFYASTIVNFSDVTYDYKATVNRARFAIMGTWHFATTDKFDPYFMAHIGYANFNYKYEQTSKFDSIAVVHPKPEISFDSPIALRLAMGGRYFFNDRFGVNAEIGLGGIFLTGGLTYKF